MVHATLPIRAVTGRSGGIPEICRRPKQYRFGHTQSIRTKARIHRVASIFKIKSARWHEWLAFKVMQLTGTPGWRFARERFAHITIPSQMVL
jgi:hypothetical protein